jgi:hypothetical protein
MSSLSSGSERKPSEKTDSWDVLVREYSLLCTRSAPRELRPESLSSDVWGCSNLAMLDVRTNFEKKKHNSYNCGANFSDRVRLCNIILCPVKCLTPVTVAAWSNAWSVFASSNTSIGGSNPTRVMDVCVCIVLCVGSGLATGWSLAQGVLHTRNWKSDRGLQGL